MTPDERQAFIDDAKNRMKIASANKRAMGANSRYVDVARGQYMRAKADLVKVRAL